MNIIQLVDNTGRKISLNVLKTPASGDQSWLNINNAGNQILMRVRVNAQGGIHAVSMTPDGKGKHIFPAAIEATKRIENFAAKVLNALRGKEDIYAPVERKFLSIQA